MQARAVSTFAAAPRRACLINSCLTSAAASAEAGLADEYLVHTSPPSLCAEAGVELSVAARSAAVATVARVVRPSGSVAMRPAGEPSAVKSSSAAAPRKRRVGGAVSRGYALGLGQG